MFFHLYPAIFYVFYFARVVFTFITVVLTNFMASK